MPLDGSGHQKSPSKTYANPAYSSANGKETVGHTMPRVRAHIMSHRFLAQTLTVIAGIWLRPTPSSHPCLTLFGSTNLNSRSANIDTELSFMLVTTSPSLRARLAEEVDGLRSHAQPWHGQERKVRPFSWFLASALSNRL